ncbi:MAG: bifunctional adenosylcobinamide kinase/adenosylcobinamide-phosphate guanylyltransferase [Gammaproteobacteria bacterium]
MKQLILGGARSGKSTLAERLAADSGLDVVYVATGWAGDAEMERRIAAHRAGRDPSWRTVEEPLDLAAVLSRESAPGRFMLVDCLTLWLSNHLGGPGGGGTWPEARAALLDVLPDLPGTVCLVSNEVGQGVVPLGEGNRRFVDESGWLHQAVAERCDRVVFVTAGLARTLKGDAP